MFPHLHRHLSRNVDKVVSYTVLYHEVNLANLLEVRAVIASVRSECVTRMGYVLYMVLYHKINLANLLEVRAVIASVRSECVTRVGYALYMVLYQ